MLDWNMNLYDCPYTEFLDYVDIHINLDIFTVFVDTILEKAETDGANLEYHVHLGRHAGI